MTLKYRQQRSSSRDSLLTRWPALFILVPRWRTAPLFSLSLINSAISFRWQPLPSPPSRSDTVGFGLIIELRLASITCEVSYWITLIGIRMTTPRVWFYLLWKVFSMGFLWTYYLFEIEPCCIIIQYYMFITLYNVTNYFATFIIDFPANSFSETTFV